MARKILLSFLGNTTYKKCRYASGDFKSEVVRFIQEALCQLHASDWTAEDAVFIFLTIAAEQNNWEGQLYNGEGLAQALAQYPNFSVTPIKNLPTGISEAEIWILFERIYNCLEIGDEVYLDITNGFRSLPMLLIVLLDYAKTLKNIQVKKIYYGAYEAISAQPTIEREFPDSRDRIAPILELTSFVALQNWTAAAANFKQYGKIAPLKTLTENSLQPLLKASEGNKAAVQLLQEINHQIPTLVSLIQTNRGKALGQFSFNQLKHLLTQFTQQDNIIQPLTAVIQEIQHKIEQFQDNDPLIWLKTAQWCNQHGLIQQGITQLQEGLVTWFCIRFHASLDADFFEYTEDKPRRLIGKTLTLVHLKIGRNNWKHINKSFPKLTRAIEADAFIQKTAKIYTELSTLRNDINHGGYQHFMPAEVFSKKLTTYISELTGILEAEAVPLPKNQMKSGLINLSPFPAKDWSLAQQEVAIQAYGEIIDWDFPAVSPTLDAKALQVLIDHYYRKILNKPPKAVHIMGELTFTFGLVERLKAVGIPCIASVWNGENTNELTDELATKFVQFRAY